MTDPHTAAGPPPASPTAVLGRRAWLRRGTLLADRDNLVLGIDNQATAPTTLTIGGGADDPQPALTLNNPDGPALVMNAVSNTGAGQLHVGGRG